MRIIQTEPALGVPLGVRLTRRETDVAAWLGEDATYSEIALRLGVSRETVRAHLRNIGRKLGVRTRHAAVARLLPTGIPVRQPSN